MGYIKKLKILFKYLRTVLIYKRLFKHFGNNNILYSVENLLKPEYMIIGSNVKIGEHLRLEAIDNYNNCISNPELIIGDGVEIGPYVHIGVANYMEIGNNTLIGSFVLITDHNHSYKDTETPITKQKLEIGSVHIGENCWIGERCIILPNVHIGRNAVIGANSVVTKNIPSYSVAVGIPAKIIKKYDFMQKEWVILR